ncbi:hypothetical protein MUO32_27450, partial [Shinella sp. CPCC 101442]|uniref:hypothetical protein n=1 Tax=Shinella sp. CPCC 101442 TaxID=2932265 RepID=UPI002152FB6A
VSMAIDRAMIRSFGRKSNPAPPLSATRKGSRPVIVDASTVAVDSALPASLDCRSRLAGGGCGINVDFRRRTALAAEERHNQDRPEDNDKHRQKAYTDKIDAVGHLLLKRKAPREAGQRLNQKMAI